MVFLRIMGGMALWATFTIFIAIGLLYAPVVVNLYRELTGSSSEPLPPEVVVALAGGGGIAGMLTAGFFSTKQ